MKTKLIFSTKTYSVRAKQWTDLPFIPRINERFNLQDILRTGEIDNIKLSAQCWSGICGLVKSVEYRHDDNDFYIEIYILCED